MILQHPTEDELQPLAKKTKSVPHKPAAKAAKKPLTVVSSDADLDDDQLGITSRTPPKSPFYRGHRETANAGKKTTNPGPSTTTPKSTDAKKKPEEKPAKENATATTNQEGKKKKKTKHRAELPDLAADQDRLYKEINDKTGKSK